MGLHKSCSTVENIEACIKMKHIVVGGDGFVGRNLSANLKAAGQDVLIADIATGEARHNEAIPHVYFDVTRPETFGSINLNPDDVVYNLSARMLSPIMTRARRHDFFWPVNHDGVQNILEWMGKHEASRLVHFTTDMIYGHTHEVPTTEDAPAGRWASTACQNWNLKSYAIRGVNEACRSASSAPASSSVRAAWAFSQNFSS